MFVITDCRISQPVVASLEELGFNTILMPPARYLQKGVASHTDMLLCVIKDKLFCHKEYYLENTELINTILDLSSLGLTLSEEKICRNYPNDVLFNACAVGDKLICNKKTVSKLILEYAEQNRFEIISVPQGYTKCSVCPVSDNSIITDDSAIAKACEQNGLDVLLVEKGHISLPDYDYGFIGGASGACGNYVYFCGSLVHHPDALKIEEFCKKHNKIPLSLSDGKLQDVGSLFFIRQ